MSCSLIEHFEDLPDPDALTLEGYQLILAHGQYFVNLGLFSKDAMHRAVTGEGPEQGMTPLKCLLSLPEGCQLILEHEQYFVDSGLLSKEALRQMVAGGCPVQDGPPIEGSLGSAQLFYFRVMMRERSQFF